MHSKWATAVSCLSDTDSNDCMPPLKPYVFMRVGRVKLLPYVKPGELGMGDIISDPNGDYSAVLLVNHGPVVSGKPLFSAAKELKETAKLVVALQAKKTRLLTDEQVTELRTTFAQI